mmetsp:Transcript_7953/g.13354  ORF Transcript_7953/g.13354 Transcript_7953/m.13354 type:complete len:146 (+) Transcript_7953:2575-3012(+)
MEMFDGSQMQSVQVPSAVPFATIDNCTNGMQFQPKPEDQVCLFEKRLLSQIVCNKQDLSSSEEKFGSLDVKKDGAQLRTSIYSCDLDQIKGAKNQMAVQLARSLPINVELTEFKVRIQPDSGLLVEKNVSQTATLTLQTEKQAQT